MNAITIWVVLMLMSITLNVLSVWLGVEEMMKLSKFTNWLMFIILSVKYISMGLYYMVTKRWPTSPPPNLDQG